MVEVIPDVEEAGGVRMLFVVLTGTSGVLSVVGSNAVGLDTGVDCRDTGVTVEPLTEVTAAVLGEAGISGVVETTVVREVVLGTGGAGVEPLEVPGGVSTPGVVPGVVLTVVPPDTPGVSSLVDITAVGLDTGVDCRDTAVTVGPSTEVTVGVLAEPGTSGVGETTVVREVVLGTGGAGVEPLEVPGGVSSSGVVPGRAVVAAVVAPGVDVSCPQWE